MREPAPSSCFGVSLKSLHGLFKPSKLMDMGSLKDASCSSEWDGPYGSPCLITQPPAGCTVLESCGSLGLPLKVRAAASGSVPRPLFCGGFRTHSVAQTPPHLPHQRWTASLKWPAKLNPGSSKHLPPGHSGDRNNVPCLWKFLKGQETGRALDCDYTSQEVVSQDQFFFPMRKLT